MKKNIILLLLFIINGHSQPIISEKISSNSAPYDQYLETDEYGYDYFLNNNVLIKQKNQEFFEFKSIALGNISRIDLNNPLKIVLFYENFNTIITLDNQLNESRNINLSTFESPILATASGISSQNRFWIFDSLSQKIGLFDSLSNSYVEITPPLQFTKKYYDSDFNTFFWVDDLNMMHSCDVFGKITTSGKITDFEKIQILDSRKVLILQNNQLFLNDLENNKIRKIEISEKTIDNFSYKNQILTIFTNQKLYFYKIKI